MDEMKVRTIENPEGAVNFFNYNTFIMGLNYSKYLTTNFAIGFNVKYISENLWHMNSTGFAIDIEYFYIKYQFLMNSELHPAFQILELKCSFPEETQQ